MGNKTMLITGDVSCDVNIYKGDKTFSKESGLGTAIKKEAGGAHLLFRLIEAIKKQETSSSDYTPHFGFKKELTRRLASFPGNLTSYATWQPFGKRQGWKVFDLLGFGNEPSPPSQKKKATLFFETHLDTDLKNPEILVVDDGAGRFRNQPYLWEHLFQNESRFEHIILKMASPVAKGKLFNRLLKLQTAPPSLLIITSLDEIRREDVLISKGVSWEQTALDLVYELNSSARLRHLLFAKHLIITMGSEGALYMTLEKGRMVKARLVFDPAVQEGEWEISRGMAGGVIGLMSCFTAGVVAEFMSGSDNFDFAVTRGLSAQRRYKLTGHGFDSREFPFKTIAADIVNPKTDWFASAVVPIPKNTAEKTPDITGLKFKNLPWTILEGNYLPEKEKQPLYDVGFRLAVMGENEMANVPHLKVNYFMTYDRSEIESLRNLNNLISDYLANDKGKKPLSLAVFGAPGAGKSFAVNQIAESRGMAFVEFNLSQFEDVNELTGAFHQVRDVVLTGKTPIIFWDEFDSQNFRWLQYLLAPMQDGKFQEGQITHPIGKCIFIFAGGTSYTFQTFGTPAPDYPDAKDKEYDLKKQVYENQLKRFQEFKLKKGPDFKSRLTGYLNVLGPNQLERLDRFGNVILDEKEKTPVKDNNDIFFPVRRALFIRAIFGKKSNEVLEGDTGLIYALLRVDKFKHGSRSLEKILSQLKIKNNGQIKRSGLPAFNVLSMLVDYDEFIGLMDEKDDFENQAHTIAPHIHANWMKIGDTDGWKMEYHKPYPMLPSHLKGENIAAASRIREILNLAGLKAVRKEEADFYETVDFEKILQNKATLTMMAKEEHAGWIAYKESQQWEPSKIRNDDQKMHNCMVEWEKLSINEKNKDKDAVRNYPDGLKRAGFIIVRADE